MRCWAVRWISENKLDGRREYYLGDAWKSGRHGPRMFRTREQARQWRDKHFGYIKGRKDLHAEPHGWRLPIVERVTLKIDKENCDA